MMNYQKRLFFTVGLLALLSGLLLTVYFLQSINVILIKIGTGYSLLLLALGLADLLWGSWVLILHFFGVNRQSADNSASQKAGKEP
jgi:hypothetical protein